MFKKYYLCLILFIFSPTMFANSVIWQNLAPGLEYTNIKTGFSLFNGQVHAFRINLKNEHLDLAFAKELQKPTTTIKDFVTANNAYIGINGGFFSPQAQSLGLRLKNGLIVSPLKSISWWGVFYISNNKPMIVNSSNFHSNKTISFAIQSGPRLIINGQIPNLKPGVDDRSALGITRDGQVIIVATENMPLTTEELAQIMAKPNNQGGLDCYNAINLDGGTSTQVYAQVQNFVLNVPGYKPVADAVLVLPNR